MGSSGGGDSTSSGTTTVRYAEYVEAAHQGFLSSIGGYAGSAAGNNPYNSYSGIDVDVGFFGSGYTLASYPSLYDMFGKFIAGLNIEAIWSELFNDTVNSSEATKLVQAERSLLKDTLDSETLPRFMTGARDINAVNTSTFIIGRGLLEDGVDKQVAKFSAELKYRLIATVQDRYKAHLGWNQGVIDTYQNIMKHYFTIKNAFVEMDYNMLDRKGRWPLEMLDYQRAGLGALQGATKTSTSGQSDSGSSSGSSALGGALAGASVGASMGGPWGAAIGGAVGGVAGLLF